MTVFKHVNEGFPALYTFLKKSFPRLTRYQYQKVNFGKKFLNWILLQDINGELLAVCAIFKRDKYYKMGLFCVHPDKRRQGIGTMFYNYVIRVYHPLEWSSTPDSTGFYLKMGAKVSNTILFHS